MPSNSAFISETSENHGIKLQIYDWVAAILYNNKSVVLRVASRSWQESWWRLGVLHGGLSHPFRITVSKKKAEFTWFNLG